MADELKGALEVLSRTESSIEARLVLSEGMSVFDGHFPCLAILPGVVQLNLVETNGPGGPCASPPFPR